MENIELIEQIQELKHKKNATIVAHNYQIEDVQKIADIVGDSLALSKYCATSDAETVVFCGVHFMAESAKILSPQKNILLPEKDAGCPMADMANAEDLRDLKKKHPDALVVTYINSTAEVKAESDICCTSSNAIEVIKSVTADKIIFVPDQNLGSYVSGFIPEKQVILWEGYCITHHRVTKEDVILAKNAHPDALCLMHPECRPEVVALADFVGSTKNIIDFANNSSQKKFIIGTEMGVLVKLKEMNPDKQFYLLSQGLVCPNMKKTSLKSVYNALLQDQYKIEVDEAIRLKAKACLERMIG